MKYKAGDIVRIRPKEWIDAQEKDKDGDIKNVASMACFINSMFRYAGRIARIIAAQEKYYDLDIDGGKCCWEEWMFDPEFNPDEPLSADDAIRAMLDGETLYNEKGHEYRWVKKRSHFIKSTDHEFTEGAVYYFDGLCRRPAKRKRPYTQEEAKAWAESEDSLGWMARISEDNVWNFPRNLGYGYYIPDYQRARLLPDNSGIDESTIQGFEIEAEE
jgi:hypothetical protein